MSWQIFFNLETEEQKAQCLTFLHKKILHNFLNKKIRLEDAEDLAQDVCVKTMNSLDKILKKCQSIDHLKNYIYRLSKNVLLDFIHKKKQQSAPREIEEITIETPESILLEKELIKTLHDCMAKINDNWCEILIWKDVDDKSANEILLLSGIAERTQRQWRTKAKEQLKICMENSLQSQ